MRERDEIVDDRCRIRVKLDESRKKIIELERDRNKKQSDHDERVKEQDETIDDLVNERDVIADDRYEIRVELEETKKKMNILTRELRECQNNLVSDKKVIDKQAYKIPCLKSELLYVNATNDELPDSVIDITANSFRESSASSKSIDSGINLDLHSFKEFMSERIDVMLDEKLKGLLGSKEIEKKEETQDEKDKEEKNKENNEVLTL